MTRFRPTLAGALALAAAPALAALDETVVGGAEPVPLPDGTVLRLVEVTDQRCPSDVQCVWEGTARAVLSVEPPGRAAERLVLCNACDDGAREGRAGGWVFAFVALAPDTATVEALGREPALADYAARLIAAPSR